MYIYKITNLINGHCYVGLKTSDVEQSKNYYGSGKLIQNAIKKYGKHNFTKEILETNIDNFQLLCERERYYIQLYDTKNNGYNMTDGGLGMYGYKPTEEHKKNMSKSISSKVGIKKSKETKQLLSNIAKERKGRPVSAQTRLILAETQRGRIKTQEEKDKQSKSLSNSLIGKPLPISDIPCLHCGKIMAKSHMTRWHGDRCKYKKS